MHEDEKILQIDESLLEQVKAIELSSQQQVSISFEFEDDSQFLQMGESAFSIEALETTNNQQIQKYLKDQLKYL